MDTASFFEKSNALARAVSGWLDSTAEALGVNRDETKKLGDRSPLFAGSPCALTMCVHRNYHGAKATFEKWNVSPDRYITVEIGHTDGDDLRIFITSSLLEKPIELIAPSEAALKEAVTHVHEKIFVGFPLSGDEMDEHIRRHIPLDQDDNKE
ncbi:MAG: hypothetical protein WCK55_09090 [Verrucomicrobiota bacterium]